MAPLEVENLPKCRTLARKQVPVPGGRFAQLCVPIFQGECRFHFWGIVETSQQVRAQVSRVWWVEVDKICLVS
jgi:hypothetical protein